MVKKVLYKHLVEDVDPNKSVGKGTPVNRLPRPISAPVSSLNPLTIDEPIGYGTGTGGAITQSTSKSTGVTLNKLCGQITLHNATLNADTAVSFTLTNSKIDATDVVFVNVATTASANSYTVGVTAVASGSCRIQLHNISAGNLGEALVLNFVVIKSVAA